MDNPIKLTEKYERNGWPSLKRPDLDPPEGWSLSLLTSLERIRSHALSPDGRTITYIKDGESLSDVYLLPSRGGWPARMTTDRPLANYWDDEIPAWSPDGNWLAFCIKDMSILSRARVACRKRSLTSPALRVVRALCPIRME